MNPIEKQYIKHYHSERLKQNRNLAHSQGWSSYLVQQKRFEVISSLLNFDDVSILDIGCGCGGFKEYLDQKFKDFDYIGVDQQPEFIQNAQNRFAKQNNTWFHLADFTCCQLPSVDIVVASGALSYYCNNPDYYIASIKKLYASANRAFVFNMLDQDNFESGSLIIAHDKEYIYRQCKQLCDKVTLKTAYLDNDFTILMERE